MYSNLSSTGSITAEIVQTKSRKGGVTEKRILRVIGTIVRTGTSTIPGSRTITVDAGGREITAHLNIDPELSTSDYPGGPLANPIADAEAGQQIVFVVSDRTDIDGNYTGYRLAETFSLLTR